jgi:uncharacterized protein (TIGR03437 family)
MKELKRIPLRVLMSVMKGFSNWNGACAAALLWATAFAVQAQTLTTLASFGGPGGAPGPLVQSTDGNFYGTTLILSGGSNSILKISPGGTVTTLYTFCSQGGCVSRDPQGRLVRASDGNFYGTTALGGVHYDNTSGSDTIFKLTPNGTLTTLYSFCAQANCADGFAPAAGLIQASDGNFYGTTSSGGIGSYGTVFKFTPGGALTTLHTFCSNYPQCADGGEPLAALIQASDGNLYGTTYYGGANYDPSVNISGTVFKITPGGTLTTLYSFCAQANCTDGQGPVAGLVQASDGNLYGTTVYGGSRGLGTIFKITPGGTLTTLYSICSQSGCIDGDSPIGGLVQASDGNLYGTMDGGGANGNGTAFKITFGGTLTTVYNFCSQANCADGGYPNGLIQATDGNLYGTNSFGGVAVPLPRGTFFKLTLAPTPPPAINPSGGIVSGASFQPGIAAASWITIYGTNLSAITDTWASSIVNGVLPIALDKVSVSVGGVPAYIYYISPMQINALAPSVGPGPVPVTVTNPIGTTIAITATAQTLQPAFFLWPGNYAVATRQDYSYAVKNGTFSTPTTPAKPGDVIVLWGTGFGPTSPSAPPGFETPSTTVYNTASPVTVTVGGVPATVYGSALAPGDAGLYQVAIQIPTSLANGDYAVVATISGAQSPSTTLVTVQD